MTKASDSKDEDKMFNGKECRSCGGTLRYKKSERCVHCLRNFVQQYKFNKRVFGRGKLENIEDRMRGVWYSE